RDDRGQPCHGPLLVLELPTPLDGHARGQRRLLLEGRPGVGDESAQVTTAHVHPYPDVAAAVLAVDARPPHPGVDRGQRAQRYELSALDGDPQGPDLVEIVTGRRR